MIQIEDHVIYNDVTVGCVVPNTSDDEELYLVDSLADVLGIKPNLVIMASYTVTDVGYGLSAISLPDVYRVLARYRPGFERLIFDRIMLTGDAQTILSGGANENNVNLL